MTQAKGKLLLLVVGLVLALSARADLGSMLGNTCAGCHGLNGASAGETMPIIAGLPRDFILMAMKEYREGIRGSTIMGRIAKGYNDQQLMAISEFFAKQTWLPAAQRFDQSVLERGEKLHRKRCEACHRDNGTSMALDMQPLAGQWAGYLRIYMSTCRDAKWKSRHPDAMTSICNDLSDGDVAALVQFYASQK
ncbi:c-type cytochrome [Sulfuricystis multivorans]|uniref:c-type cytochrome n=1 Tax=Sulfuricystis multivorans TaxID=2211108 RepID=UPI000F81B026|nr:c-type cytochrome [Sulfuricystis multivorans]